MKKVDRNLAIWLERHKNRTYAEIAIKFGLSPSRVRDILDRQKRGMERHRRGEREEGGGRWK